VFFNGNSWNTTKAIKKRQKLTQQQLADKVGVSKTSVIYWEKDENVPKHESLMLLASALDVSLLGF
jgi:transcriptional regulator with XRE-family HTH domain